MKELTSQSLVTVAGRNSTLFGVTFKKLKELYEVVKSKKEVASKFKEWKLCSSFAYESGVNEDLFLKHAYLDVVVKTLAARLLTPNVNVSTLESNVASGKFFEELGVKNYVEKNFFSWLLDEKVRREFHGVVSQVLFSIVL